jgi:hypothetical protein
MSLVAFLSPPRIFRDGTSNKMHIFWEVSLELLNPEDGGNNILRNLANDLPIDAAKYPGRRIFSKQYTGGERTSPLSASVLCRRLQRAKIPDAVCIQSFLLKMGILMLETCRG